MHLEVTCSSLLEQSHTKWCPPFFVRILPLRVPAWNYKLDICDLQATELPRRDGRTVSIENRIGLHQFVNTVSHAVVQKMCVQWDKNCAVSILNLQFPKDVDQIPDLSTVSLYRSASL